MIKKEQSADPAVKTQIGLTSGVVGNKRIAERNLETVGASLADQLGLAENGVETLL